MRSKPSKLLSCVLPLTAGVAAPALAQEGDAAKLAKAVQNAVADLSGVPFPYNANFAAGPGEDTRNGSISSRSFQLTA